MSRHESPLTCCDLECAAANGCREGGYQCEDCGNWFCGHEVVEGDDGVCRCDDCAEIHRRELEEEEEQEQEAEDGE